MGDPAWMETEPAWTMSEEAFSECLRFFAKHYEVIGMEHLLQAHLGAQELPERSLIITFDDGWADTAEFALPLLKSQGLPATVFVVANAVGEDEFWQETVIRAWRQRRLSALDYGRLWERSAEDHKQPPLSWDDAESVWSLISRLNRLDAEQRSSVLEDFRPLLGRPVRRQMLSEAELRKLNEAGVTIGSHGLTHTPIPYSQNRTKELTDSRALLCRQLGVNSEGNVRAFSFPHGVYDRASVIAAENAGYQFIFTSDKNVNIMQQGVRSQVFGRINMDGSALSDSSGKLRPELLALWLFDRLPRIADEV